MIMAHKQQQAGSTRYNNYGIQGNQNSITTLTVLVLFCYCFAAVFMLFWCCSGAATCNSNRQDQAGTMVMAYRATKTAQQHLMFWFCSGAVVMATVTAPVTVTVAVTVTATVAVTVAATEQLLQQLR